MPSELRFRRRVEFSETDLAGIMHFSNYFRFMEAAEHAFLRSLGVTPHGRVEGRVLGWPRVSVSCDFAKPLHFEDEVEVHVLVREKRARSLRYEFVLRRAGEEVARGSMTVVCVELSPGEPMKPVPIPGWLADRIEIAAP